MKKVYIFVLFLVILLSVSYFILSKKGSDVSENLSKIEETSSSVANPTLIIKKDESELIAETSKKKITTEILDQEVESVEAEIAKMKPKFVDGELIVLSDKNIGKKINKSEISEKEVFYLWNGFHYVSGQPFNIINYGKFFEVKSEVQAKEFIMYFVNSHSLLKDRISLGNLSVNKKESIIQYCLNQNTVVEDKAIDIIESGVCIDVSSNNNNIIEVSGSIHLINEKLKFNSYNYLDVLSEFNKENKTNLIASNYIGEYLIKAVDGKFHLAYKFNNSGVEYIIDSEKGLLLNPEILK